MALLQGGAAGLTAGSARPVGVGERLRPGGREFDGLELEGLVVTARVAGRARCSIRRSPSRRCKEPAECGDHGTALIVALILP